MILLFFLFTFQMTESMASSSGEYLVSGTIYGFDEKVLSLKNGNRLSLVKRKFLPKGLELTMGNQIEVTLNELQFSQVEFHSLTSFKKK